MPAGTLHVFLFNVEICNQAVNLIVLKVFGQNLLVDLDGFPDLSVRDQFLGLFEQLG